MGRSISFDGNSLQTANILTQDIDSESIPTKVVNTLALAHASGSRIPFTGYSGKTVRVSGLVVGSSVSDLDSKLDTFRGYFNGQDKNLDIGYGGSTRRYIATVNSLVITRPGGLMDAKFDIEFICTQPFGQNTATTSALSASSRTSATYTDSYTFLGTAPYQRPVWTITFNSAVTGTSNLVTNPGFETNTTGWSSGGIGTFTRVTAQHNTGVAAGQMVNAASSPLSVPSANNYGWELYAVSGLTPGATYTVSLWVKGNAGAETVKASTLSSAVSTLTLTTGWQQISFTFVAGFTTDQIYVWSTTASATWFLDDVSIVVDSAAIVSVGNPTNGQQIDVTHVFLPADVLVVDVINKVVTLNATPIDFGGAFPEFAPGAQSLYYVDNFTSRNFNISVAYYPMFQ